MVDHLLNGIVDEVVTVCVEEFFALCFENIDDSAEAVIGAGRLFLVGNGIG